MSAWPTCLSAGGLGAVPPVVGTSEAMRFILRVRRRHASRPAEGLARGAVQARATWPRHNEHPDHQLRVDGGTADGALEGLQLLVDAAQIGLCIDLPKEMIVRDLILETEIVEKTLRSTLEVHHRSVFPAVASEKKEPLLLPTPQPTFSKKSAMSRHSTPPWPTSALLLKADIERWNFRYAALADMTVQGFSEERPDSLRDV